VTQTHLEKLENNTLKSYEHVVRMGDNRWPKRKMTWSPEGSRRQGRHGVQWETEVKRVMKRRSLTFDEAINWQL
jgi:hypothetical protein